MGQDSVKVGIGVFVFKNGKFLMQKRHGAHGSNSWGVPGGHLEFGESFEATARREVLEETGLKIKLKFPIYVGEWSPVVLGVPYHIVGIFTICKPITSKVTLSQAHDDYKWIDPKDYKNFDIMDPEDKVFERYNEWNSKDHNMLGYIDL